MPRSRKRVVTGNAAILGNIKEVKPPLWEEWLERVLIA